MKSLVQILFGLSAITLSLGSLMFAFKTFGAAWGVGCVALFPVCFPVMPFVSGFYSSDWTLVAWGYTPFVAAIALSALASDKE